MFLAMNNKISILGAGESGTGAAILAKQKGFDVFVSDFGQIKDKYKEMLDRNGIRWEEKQHSHEIIGAADEVIKSPGISDTSEIIQFLRNLDKPIISEIEFASRYTNAKLICITGSNGKTTTTLLIYHILKKAGLNVGLAGNVGQSFALQVANGEFDYFVIELSSFQLDYAFEFKADIAILLNITPDHLDWYNYNFSLYTDSKFRITRNQDKTCYFLYNADDKIIVDKLKDLKIDSEKLPFSIMSEVQHGGCLIGNSLIINHNNLFKMNIDELALQGKHNIYNSLAAGISAKILDIKNPIIRESLMDFRGVEHRLEKYIKVRGILFINDSKSTNINSCWYALESMEKKTIWIAGGIDKGNDYSVLMPLVKEKVKAIIALGKNTEKIHQAFDGVVPIVNALSMEEAVKSSYNLASDGDIVLLSPACASFDLFKNYEDRGEQFKQCVRKL
jgi:UDP-N-acetylmuramoylalanine--D-glutamate ligase